MTNTERPTIGTVTLTEDTTVRNSYETAGWYQAVRVKAGFTAPIVAARLGDDPLYWIIVPRGEGEVVGSDFTSSFGGLRYGSKIDEDKGKTAQAQPMQLYGYSFAAAIVENGGMIGPWRVELSPEWKAEAYSVMLPALSDRIPAKMHHSHRIVRAA